MKLVIEENCTGEKTITNIREDTPLCLKTLARKYFKELYYDYEVKVFFEEKIAGIGEYYVALTEDIESSCVWESMSVWVEIN